MGAKRQPHSRGAKAPRVINLRQWAAKWGPLLGAIAAIFAILASIVAIVAFILDISGRAGTGTTTINNIHVDPICLVESCQSVDDPAETQSEKPTPNRPLEADPLHAAGGVERTMCQTAIERCRTSVLPTPP